MSKNEKYFVIKVEGRYNIKAYYQNGFGGYSCFYNGCYLGHFLLKNKAIVLSEHKLNFMRKFGNKELKEKLK